MKISAAIILDYLGDQVTRHNICPDFDPWIYCARHYYNGYNDFSEEEACIVNERDALKIVEYDAAGLYIIADEKGTVADFNPRIRFFVHVQRTLYAQDFAWGNNRFHYYS
jgi:hypothetical protein